MALGLGLGIAKRFKVISGAVISFVWGTATAQNWGTSTTETWG
jgi:hypothetical protein